MMYRNLFFILLFFGVAFSPLFAQNTFIKQYDIASASVGSGPFIRSSDSGYIAGASVTDQTSQSPCLIKFDGQGNVVWAKTILGGLQGHVYSLAPSDNGNFFAAGPYQDTSGMHLFLLKCDSNGNTLWSWKYTDQIDSNSCAVGADESGGCIVAGNTFSDDGENILVLKLNPNGTLKWSRLIEDPINSITSYVNSIIPSGGNGDFILSGTAEFISGSLNEGSFGLSNIKIDATGFVRWFRIIEGSFVGQSATPTYDGGFAVCGVGLDNSNLFTSNLFIAKLDSNGFVQWGKQVDIFENGNSASIFEESNGDLLVCGSRELQSDTLFSPNALFVRMDQNGNFQTAKVLTYPERNAYTSGICRSSDAGSTFFGSISNDFTHGPVSLLLGKLDGSDDGCYMKNQLAATFFNDSTIDVSPTVVNGSGAHSFVFNKGIDLQLNQTVLCEESSVETSQSTQEHISLYPNPLLGNEPLKLSIDGSLPLGEYEISLLDLLGNTIKKEKINLTGANQEIALDVSTISEGIYIVEFRSEREPQAVYRMKLIKEH